MEKQHLHKGHRDRMRAKFLLDNGLCLADHELLELLLYHAIPQRDTNETAHLLMERFGSVERVLDAEPEELTAVPGVSRNAGVLVALVKELSRRYSFAKLNTEIDPVPIFNDPDKIASFLRPHYVGVTVERAYLLLFDAKMHLLDCRCLGDGSITNVLFSAREIVELALRKHASHLVLAHNHPTGLAMPSNDDLRVTRQLARTLAPLDLFLLEHFIFSKHGYCTVMSQLNEDEDEEAEQDDRAPEEPLLAATPVAFSPERKEQT